MFPLVIKGNCYCMQVSMAIHPIQRGYRYHTRGYSAKTPLLFLDYMYTAMT